MTRQLNSSATPLAALDAVVLGLTTSSQDCREAVGRDLALVPFKTAVLVPEKSLRVTVAPDHTDQPRAMTDAWDDDSFELIDNKIWIGYQIGFDLAVLKQSSRDAGRPWIQPRTLDLDLLARVLQPDRQESSLSALADWLFLEDLEIDLSSASEKALVVGRMFQAMLPWLRMADIRTLAEAEMACLRLAPVLEEQRQMGWEPAVAPPPPTEHWHALEEVEPYAYSHSTADVMTAPPVTIAGDASLSEGMALMVEKGVSSLFVKMHAGGAKSDGLTIDHFGIVTERDVLRHISDRQAAALVEPLSTLATHPLVSVPEDAFIYRAVGRMARHRLRHLAVVDERLRLTGAVSARDLLRLRVDGAAALGDSIDAAETVEDLARAWAGLTSVVESLLTVEIDPLHITSVISRQLGAATRRAALLAERQLKEEGEGAPPCPYAIAVTGDAARGEQTLAVQQNHILIYEAGDDAHTSYDTYFASLGPRIGAILDHVGVALLTEAITAADEEGRGPPDLWFRRIKDSVSLGGEDSEKNYAAILDMRPVHGSLDLVSSLSDDLRRGLAGDDSSVSGLARLPSLAEGEVAHAGRLKSRKGRVGLGRNGLDVIAGAARYLAVRQSMEQRATADRLHNLIEQGQVPELDLHRLQSAQGTLVDLVLRQQVRDLYDGIRPTRSVRLKDLRKTQQDRLRDVLDDLQTLETRILASEEGKKP